MADQDLPYSGKDVSVQLVLDGQPQQVIDQIVNFTETAMFDTIETKHLGTTNVDIDKVPIGWEGEIEIAQSNSQMDDMIDAYNFAKVNRIPIIINISRTKNFRDGSSNRVTYPLVQIDWSTSVRRAQAGTVRIPWRTGLQRF